MGLRDLFGKKTDAPAAAAASAISSSTYTTAVDVGPCAVVTVLVEKYTEREAQALQQEILAAASGKGHHVVVDMHKVMMLASAGIGSLVQVHRACAGAGGRMVLAALDPDIAEMLKLSRMDKLFTFADSVDAATKKLA
jgi:anti-sigma B factor antagonist